MALSNEQTAAKAFLTTDTHSYTINGETKTIAEFYSIGNDTACLAVMNDRAFGASLSKQVQKATVPANELLAAMYTPDYAGLATKADIQGLVPCSSDSVGLSPVYVNALRTAVANGGTGNKSVSDALEAYILRDASVWESFVKKDGATFTQEDLSAIRAS